MIGPPSGDDLVIPVTMRRPPETSPSHKTPSSVLLKKISVRSGQFCEDCVKIENLGLGEIDREVF
jgi:hypothetical protein